MLRWFQRILNIKFDEEEKSEKLMEALAKLEIVNKKAADEDSIVGDLNRLEVIKDY